MRALHIWLCVVCESRLNSELCAMNLRTARTLQG